MNIIGFRLPFEAEPKIFVAGDAKPVDFQDKEFRFIIKPFEQESESLQYKLTERIPHIPDLDVSNLSLEDNPEFDISRYAGYIEYIKEKLGNNPEHKIVSSRRVSIPLTKSPDELFHNLCAEYPESFIFYLSTKEFGTWIGASPELLAKKEGNLLQTMALAGTRAAGMNEPWDVKNVMEQRIVTDFITDIFRSFDIKYKVHPLQTKQAGKIEHIMTPIEGVLEDNSDVEKILGALSPTPALSGHPRKLALEVIGKFEGSRGLYGGFMGPIAETGDFVFNVILRCARLERGRATLYAGGGITSLSEIEEEWMETEKKLETLRRFL